MLAGEFTLERPKENRKIRIEFQEREAGLGEMFVIEELRKGYGSKLLFDRLSLRITPGMRLGITGPNGTGKSTLLKILMGLVIADSGQVRRDPKARVGYFAQESAELDPQRTVLEELRIAFPELTEQRARSLLGRFLFTGDDVFKRIGQLSGGEQSRIRLMKLMMQSPDVLVLDEPTNHLDIPSREVLEDALAEFTGAIIAVSHDRYFLDRVVQRLLVMRPEGHAYYTGNYSFYIEQVEQQRSETTGSSKRDGERPSGDAAAPVRKATAKTRQQAKAKTAAKKSPYVRMTLDELEALIIKKEQEIEEINRQFADPGVCRDAPTVTRLRGAFDALKADLAEIEAAWHERVEQS